MKFIREKEKKKEIQTLLEARKKFRIRRDIKVLTDAQEKINKVQVSIIVNKL